MKVRLSGASERDFENIFDYIANENPRRALSFSRELRERCNRIGRFPLSGPFVLHDDDHGIRRVVHGRYLIFYRVQHDFVEVVRVLHGATAYESVLFPEPSGEA